MNKNCLLCGVGGQGVVLASKLIAYAAMEKGWFVRTSETIGNLPYLKRGKEEGIVIVNRKALKPVTASLDEKGYNGEEMLDFLRKKVKRLYVMDGEAICNKAGSSKTLNIALLGAAAAGNVLGISMEEMEREIKRRVKPEYQEMNLKAFVLGAQAVCGAFGQ